MEPAERLEVSNLSQRGRFAAAAPSVPGSGTALTLAADVSTGEAGGKCRKT